MLDLNPITLACLLDEKRHQLWNHNTQTNEINVSPLIDVVFILLIFFIVTTVFVEETGVDVQRPQASAADHLDKNSILIAITEAGKVIYGGNEIGSHGVQAVVRRLLQRGTQHARHHPG